ncbi:hypothetical protein GC163_15450 [bacterium]|nr:hypothetical protein [bacterium]
MRKSVCCVALLTLLYSAVCSGRIVEAASLANYVDPQVALYAEISHLDEDWTALETSTLGQRWQQSPLAELMRSAPLLQRWQHLDEKLAASSGQTLTQHLRTMFAQSVAITVTVPMEGEPLALLLAQGRDAKEMQATIATWNRLESQARITEKSFNQLTYFARSVGGSTVYYALIDDHFWLSDHEALVRDSLSRYASPDMSSSLADESTFQQAWPESTPQGSLLAYVAPRQWDQTLQRVIDENPAAQRLLQAWQAVTAMTLQLSLNGDGPALALQVGLNPEAISPAWRSWCRDDQFQPTLWQQPLPSQTLLAIGGQIDPVPIVEGLRQLMPANDRDEWDHAMQVAQAVLFDQPPWSKVGRALLDDWSACVVVRPITDQTPLRHHPFVALWTSRFSPSPIAADLRAGLENAITFSLNLALVGVNAQPTGAKVSLRKEQIDDVLHWEWTGRPEGQLAIALSPSEFRLSSSVAEWASSSNPASSPEISPAAKARLQSAGLGLWCHVGLLRQPPLQVWISALWSLQSDRTKDKRVVSLQTAIELLEAIDLSADWSTRHLRIELGTTVRGPE